MIIGIDCRLIGSKNAGIGRYVSNLVVRLVNLYPEVKWVLFFQDQDQIDELALKRTDNITQVVTHVQHYSVLEQIRLPLIFAQYQLDLLHVPHFNAPIFYLGKTIITIHDLLWHEQRGTDVTTLSSWKYYLKYLGYRLVSSITIKKASRILVPTKTVKDTLSKYYPRAEQKTVVTKEGIDESFSSVVQPSSHKAVNNNSLLYVGSLYPHKNIILVLKALKQLPDLKLKIVGSRNIFVDQVKAQVRELGVVDQVEFLGYVSDKKLINLYQTSLALVFPSLSEGFGLPGVEALAAGGLLLASDIPVFKEVYGDHAIYFNPNSVDQFIKAVTKIKEIDRTKQVISNLEYAKSFDWQQMTEQTFDQYQVILNNG